MDRFNIIAAYYLVASLYHSGQSSTGYAILSRILGIAWIVQAVQVGKGASILDSRGIPVYHWTEK